MNTDISAMRLLVYVSSQLTVVIIQNVPSVVSTQHALSTRRIYDAVRAIDGVATALRERHTIHINKRTPRTGRTSDTNGVPAPLTSACSDSRVAKERPNYSAPGAGSALATNPQHCP